MADENLYPETESPAEESKPDNNESEKPGKETTLVPSSIFPDPPEPGKTCKFKVVAVHDGEVEVEYDKSEKDEPDADEEPGDMSVADSMMGGMGGE